VTLRLNEVSREDEPPGSVAPPPEPWQPDPDGGWPPQRVAIRGLESPKLDTES